MDLIQGAASPTYVDLFVVSVLGGLDLTTVTAGTIEVFLNGATASWAATIISPTATSLTLRHVLAVGGTDVPTSGDIVMYGKLTIPSGIVETPRTQRPVRGKWETP